MANMAEPGNEALLKKKTSKRTIFNAFWIKGVGIAVSHLVTILALIFYREVPWSFFLSSLIAGFLNMLGITAGYHRLWSHKAYRASILLKYILAVLGASSWQGSIRWWVLRHRMHHRFVDTMYDPYDSTRGLWFSHFGWLFEKPKFYSKSSVINMNDMDADSVVRWNRKYTPHLVIGLGLVLPTMIGYWMGDSLAGFLYIGVIGRVISWNGIFLVNSVGHHRSVGGRRYALHSSATSSVLFAILSNGEGNHNYHHEFPHDYRHGVKWYDYDPTKWFIWICSILGLADNLVTVSDHVRLESEKTVKIQRKQNELSKLESDYVKHMSSKTSDKGVPNRLLDTRMLPVVTYDDVKKGMAVLQEKIGNGFMGPRNLDNVWIIIDDYLIDVSQYKDNHPGGSALLKNFHLRNATDMFRGGRNMHTKAANNIMRRLRIASITNENPPEKSPNKNLRRKSSFHPPPSAVCSYIS